LVNHISPFGITEIHASILSSNQQGLKVSEMQSRLLKDTGKDVCHRTVERYLAILQIKQRKNDIADGKVTREDVMQIISHARTELLAKNAG